MSPRVGRHRPPTALPPIGPCRDNLPCEPPGTGDRLLTLSRSGRWVHPQSGALLAWHYDPARDVLTVTYGPDRPVTRTVRNAGVALFLDGRGASIRAEVLRASTRHD